MSPFAIRAWSWIHKWTSLVCTVCLLMLCLTGLPLIFHDEIESALATGAWTPANPEGPLLSLDQVLDRALANRPGEVPVFMSFDIDRPVINVTTAATPDADEGQMHFASFDRTSGDLVPVDSAAGGVMDFLLQLHTDIFLGLPGMLFLGGMGFLFAVSVISGVVLYAPFMRKLGFGTLRVTRSPQLKWLDFHNLLGITAAAWILVVGLTGVINTLAVPIIDYWKSDQLADLTAVHAAAEAPPMPRDMSSLDAAIDDAQRAAPDRKLQFVAFPGGSFSTDHHYAVFLHGDTPLTEHMTTPALIDARSGELVALRAMPWYVKALSLSAPLHFGDYGGWPLKVLWALLDVLTIIVLGSGIYLWLRKRSARVQEPRAAEAVTTASVS